MAIFHDCDLNRGREGAKMSCCCRYIVHGFDATCLCVHVRVLVPFGYSWFQLFNSFDSPSQEMGLSSGRGLVPCAASQCLTGDSCTFFGFFSLYILVVTCLGLFVCELLELFLKYSELFLKYAQLCVQYVELFPKI